MQTQNAEATGLRYKDSASALGTEYYMDYIVVDDIPSERPRHVYNNPMVSLKSNEDAGMPMHYSSSEFQLAEDHWLKCGYVLNVGEYCPRCGGTELLTWPT